MDWETFFPIIFFLIAFGLPFIISRLRKGGQPKLDELVQHLQFMGVKASVIQEEEAQEWQLKRSWGEKVEGVLAIEDRNFDALALVSQSSQYGSNYYLEFLVKGRSQQEIGMKKKTSVTFKKSPPLWGKAVDVEWRGDASLSQRLNFDYDLKYKLLQSSRDGFKGGISVHPEPKYGYCRIRTGYQLLSHELFEAINAIAKHIQVSV